ncbi:MAG: UDP-N-acetylmuramoyl-L-alanyl-D-glutamate--2,6-diaminopimelate ligase [Candidatus Acetothermia bacterium]
MNPKKVFEELLSAVDYLEVVNRDECKVSGISYDSRDVGPGQAFVAIRGKNFDGHDFIKEAYDRGARAVFGEKKLGREVDLPGPYVRVKNSRKALAALSSIFYEDPTANLFVVGVTGTNGKTTTVHLIRVALGENSTNVISTIGPAGVNSPKEPVTTPESPDVHREAFRTLADGRRNFIVEVSSHGLAMERVGSVDFDVGVFTNLTRDHLDFHGTMEDYGQAKLKLFRDLSRDGLALVNGDDDFSPEVIRATRARTITFGLDSSSDVYGDRVKRTRDGIVFDAHTPWGDGRFSLNYFGLYNAYNALSAIAIGLVNGRTMGELEDTLSNSRFLPGRMERLSTENGADVYIDFAHNPGGLRESLSELNHLYSSVSVIFGCGGQSDRGKRPEMGEIAVSLADNAIITTDNPKSEDPRRIIDEIEEGIPPGLPYQVIVDRKKAIRTGLEDLSPGEALLIAGKGHERYQIFEDEVVEYSDLEFVKEIINS